ncbi:MAG: hypothetical protein UE295_07295 [Acutalibacteraceae bacterium]|nr:hypothetical protein [Acutalibacteraceae bacterium]
MKLKLLNYISAVSFFISSSTLLFIPMLNLENDFPVIAYFLAGTFWGLLLLGIILQIFLTKKTRKIKTRKSLKLLKKIILGILLISIIMMFFILIFLRANPFALPINLFLFLISIEFFSVICRMEKLL